MYAERGSWGLLTGWGGNKLVSYTLGLQSQASTNMAKLILNDRYLRLDPEIDTWELERHQTSNKPESPCRKGFHLPIQSHLEPYKETHRMKRVEDFNEFLADHVNINQNRLDKLNDHVAAVTTHLSRHLESFEKVERQGSYALRTIIKPKENKEYDADVLLFMKYQKGEKPAEYINDVYNCLRQHGTYKDMVHRRTRCVMVDYAGDFHLDIVPCVEINGQRYVCNNKTDQFEITDGTGYRGLVQRQDKNHQRQPQGSYPVAEVHEGPQRQFHRPFDPPHHPHRDARAGQRGRRQVQDRS